MNNHSQAQPAPLLFECLELASSWLAARPLIIVAGTFSAGVAASTLAVSTAFAFISAFTLIGFGMLKKAPYVFSGISLLMGCGWGWMAFQPGSGDISHVARGGKVRLLVELTSDPEHRHEGSSTYARVLGIENSPGRFVEAGGGVKVWLGGERENPKAGDLVQLSGNLEAPKEMAFGGGFSEAAYLRTQGVFAKLHAADGAWRVVGRSSSPTALLVRGAAWLRRDLASRLDQILPRAEAGLLAGIMLGSRSALPLEIQDDMALAGLSHITASSGANLALVGAAAWWIAPWIRPGRRFRGSAVILVMAAYTILAGASPSIIRADIMGTVLVGASLFRRDPDIGCALAATVLAVAVVRPGDLFNPGAQLSFVCVLGLVGGGSVWKQIRRISQRPYLMPVPPTDGKLARLHSGLLDQFAALASAQTAALPIMAYHFNTISVLGYASNVFAFILVEWLMLSGFAAWPLLAVFPWAGSLIAPLLRVPLELLINLSRVSAGLVNWTVSIQSFHWSVPIILITLGSAGLFCLSVHLARREREIAT